MGWVIVGSVAFAVGGAFMKSSDGFTRPWPSAALVALFIIGAVLLALAVRSEGLSIAYTVGLGVEAVISIGLGRYVFGEPVRAAQAFGVALILAGVATVRYG